MQKYLVAACKMELVTYVLKITGFFSLLVHLEVRVTGGKFSCHLIAGIRLPGRHFQINTKARNTVPAMLP